MSEKAAIELFGEDVLRAVREAPQTQAPDELPRTVRVKIRALGPGGFRAWALAQPWEVFCAIVCIVSGDTTNRLLREP